MRVLIVGCGFLGSAVGERCLRQGHTVVGVVHSHASAENLGRLGMTPRVADCADPASARKACEGGADAVLFSLSSQGGDYRKTYVEGMRSVLAALHDQPPRLLVYTGSASVYAQTDGGWVVETSPAEPLHENGKLLLQTEHLLEEAARRRFSATVLRLSGIYGPGRRAMLTQLEAGAKELPGNGQRWVNHIHRDDAAAAVMREFEGISSPKTAADFQIVNVTDDEPVLQRDYVAWICRRLGRPLPIWNAARKSSDRRGPPPHRRISNQKLRARGWIPQYPSYREGLGELGL